MAPYSTKKALTGDCPFWEFEDFGEEQEADEVENT